MAWQPKSAEPWRPMSAEPADSLGAPAEATRTGPMASTNFNRDWARGGINAIPAVMGMLGGLSAAPAAPAFPLAPIIMAGAGGSGGEAIKQLLNRATGLGPAPETAGQALRGISQQGNTQAALETVGQGAGLMLSKLAPMLGRAGIKASPTLQAEFPGLEKTMIRERAMTAGAADAARAKSAANTASLLNDAEQAGMTATAADIAAPALNRAEKALRRPLTQAERGRIIVEVRDRANQLLEGRTMGIPRVPSTPGGNPAAAIFSPTETKELAQIAQDEASSMLRQDVRSPRGEAVPRSTDYDIAKGAAAAKNKLPGVGASEKRTQELIGLQRALEARAASHNPTVPQLVALGAGGATGGLVGHGALPAELSALAAYGATSPAALRAYALGLTHPAFRPTMGALPLGLEALLRYAQGQTQQTAP